MIRPDISGKVALGYIVVLILLIGTIYYVTMLTADSSRHDAEMGRLVDERLASEHLVMAVLDCQTAATAASLGNSDDIAAYNVTVDSAMAAIERMATADTVYRPMLDSLATALIARRDNVLELASLLTGRDEIKAYTRQVEDLVEKNDTARRHVQTIQHVVVQQREVTVNKPRRNFFGRVADVFRPGRTDTVGTSVNDTSVSLDTVTTVTNSSSGMSTSLDNINRKLARRMEQRSRRLSSRIASTREAGVAIAAQVNTLLIALQQARRQQFDRQSAEVIASRRNTIMILCAIALFAIFWVGVLFFITRRDVVRSARYRDEIEEARDHAEQLLEEREKLLLTIAHNIKSPAAAVGGYASLLAQTPLSDSQLKDVDCINRSAGHLMQLVTTLLDYNKLSRGMMETHFKPFSLLRLITDIVDGARPIASSKGLDLTMNVDTGTQNIVSDPLILRQIIENLVSNAIKYTRHGSVAIETSLAGNRLTVTVADTGVGLTDHEKQQVFDEFVRLEGSHGSEGAGLGLAITLRLVHLLGGTIDIDSTKNVGSRFSITVPVNVTDEKERATETETETASQLGISPESKIIVVDDDEIQRRLTVAVLNKSHYDNVLACGSAAEALELMKVMHPDVVITDLRMPDMDGRELAALIKADDPSIKVVCLTANLQIDDSADFDMVVSKPLQPSSSSDGIDTSGLIEFAAGDPVAEREIMTAFITDCNQNLERLQRDLADDNLADAAECAHKMIPTFTLINAPALDELRHLESRRGSTAIEQADRKAITTAIAALKQILSAVRDRYNHKN